MNEKKDFALVRRPSSAIEKATPRTKRILSGMAVDTLILAKKEQLISRTFKVAIYGEHGGLGEDDFLGQAIQNELGDNCIVKLNLFSHSEKLIKATNQKTFDLLIVFLNPGLSIKDKHLDAFEFVSELKTNLQKPIIICSNEIIYGRNMFPSFMKVGADAFLGMLFSWEEFRLALKSCGLKLKN